MADRVVVAAAGGLFDVLAAQLPTWRRNTLRERLRLGCIVVNGTPARRPDVPVAVGDVVTILGKDDAPPDARGSSARDALPVLFADDDLVAIDKPAGLLSVSTDDGHARTAMARLGRQLAPGRGVPLWPVHRLDRETSGVLLFARSREARDAVQARWAAAEKDYVAIVEGHLVPADRVVDAPLWEDGGLRVRVGDHADARPARTHVRTLARGPHRSRLAVVLDTGRKHQIRVHLAWCGHPVVGDDRYGIAGPRLCLHAHRLAVPHPRDGRPLVLTAAVPAVFDAELAAGPVPRSS